MLMILVTALIRAPLGAWFVVVAQLRMFAMCVKTIIVEMTFCFRGKTPFAMNVILNPEILAVVPSL